MILTLPGHMFDGKVVSFDHIFHIMYIRQAKNTTLVPQLRAHHESFPGLSLMKTMKNHTFSESWHSWDYKDTLISQIGPSWNCLLFYQSTYHSRPIKFGETCSKCCKLISPPVLLISILFKSYQTQNQPIFLTFPTRTVCYVRDCHVRDIFEWLHRPNQLSYLLKQNTIQEAKLSRITSKQKTYHFPPGTGVPPHISKVTQNCGTISVASVISRFP